VEGCGGGAASIASIACRRMFVKMQCGAVRVIDPVLELPRRFSRAGLSCRFGRARYAR